jgi:hypothetical protein
MPPQVQLNFSGDTHVRGGVPLIMLATTVEADGANDTGQAP